MLTHEHARGIAGDSTPTRGPSNGADHPTPQSRWIDQSVRPPREKIIPSSGFQRRVSESDRSLTSRPLPPPRTHQLRRRRFLGQEPRARDGDVLRALVLPQRPVQHHQQANLQLLSVSVVRLRHPPGGRSFDHDVLLDHASGEVRKARQRVSQGGDTAVLSTRVRALPDQRVLRRSRSLIHGEFIFLFFVRTGNWTDGFV